MRAYATSVGTFIFATCENFTTGHQNECVHRTRRDLQKNMCEGSIKDLFRLY